MFVAADDTDSMRGNCTTFLASEIIRVVTGSGWDLIGYPRLVRLNPAIPWKTRGNGALVMRFGRGEGSRTFIGNISGNDVFCYSECSDEEPEIDFLENLIRPVVERFHDPDDSDPGILISRIQPDYKFYRNGVTRVMNRSDIENEIIRIGARKLEWGCGRGIIGCVCGSAWIPSDKTYELLSYRPQSRWGTKRIFDSGSVEKAEHEITSSFNSWDNRHRKVAMVPATPCPVMYGFRADIPDDLLKGHDMIITEEQERWLIFETNQGTDDHIIADPTVEEFIPNSSYALDGVVKGVRRIRGGHTFVDLDTSVGTVTAGIYAPAEEFRFVLDWLMPGDLVRIYGELRDEPRTLNIEKIQVKELVRNIVRGPNPVCVNCGRKMSSIGRNSGYRCRACGTKSDAITIEKHRNLVKGWYEPPTEARRHLSKPLKRMNLEQPLGILRCRNPSNDD